MTAAAVILAAGAGRRLGGVAKALLPGDRGSFLATVVATARDAGVGGALVVVGPPYADAVTAEAQRLSVHVEHNSHPERGMASSIAIGFARALEVFEGATGALLWPVDHARLRVETVRAIVDRGTVDNIAVPTWDRRGGHPTWFGRSSWNELAGCVNAADGARGVVRADPARVVRFPVDDPGVVRDVDTAEDLR